MRKIFSSKGASAAVNDDGRVITWGDAGYGGDSSAVREELQSGVRNIFSTRSAFAAVKDDGRVITWGKDGWGGDSSAVREELQSGVCNIFSTASAFAAVKDDGRVITWGVTRYGGESSGVSIQRNWPGIGFNTYWNNGNTLEAKISCSLEKLRMHTNYYRFGFSQG